MILSVSFLIESPETEGFWETISPWRETDVFVSETACFLDEKTAQIKGVKGVSKVKYAIVLSGMVNIYRK